MRQIRNVICAGWLLTLTLNVLDSAETITLQRGGSTIQVEGQIVVEAQDGGLLLCARDGRLWMVQPDEIVQRSASTAAFQPYTSDEMAERLLGEMSQGPLPGEFRIHRTAHFIICYNTSPSYARWYGSLVERLFFGFQTYWSHQDFELEEPQWPLIALVFRSKADYEQHARAELGGNIGSVFGYYNVQTNRVSTYDVTAPAAVRGPRTRSLDADRINAILARPGARETVATIVHEATHQLAYNSGLQVRFADNPFWVSEGLAAYFETPDLKSQRGWQGIGKINPIRRQRFLRYLSRRPPDSLRTLLTDDRRFRDSQSAKDSYAEAWALNFYLLRKHPDSYVRYLKHLASKKPLVAAGPEARIAEFKQYFGANLAELDRDFVRSIRALK